MPTFIEIPILLREDDTDEKLERMGIETEA
jgi:hypothetical protein